MDFQCQDNGHFSGPTGSCDRERNECPDPSKDKTREVHARLTQEMTMGMNIPGLEQALEQFGKQAD